MSESELSRRQFHKLTAAALGGLVAAGCGDKKKTPEKTDGKTATDSGKTGGGSGTQGETEEVSLLTQEPHVCKGLNTCKGQGRGKDNACAGQGTCHTAPKSSCKGMNECKGRGGCGNTAGRNACKNQGECAVPLKEETWKNARAAFEKAMEGAGKTVGPAPTT